MQKLIKVINFYIIYTTSNKFVDFLGIVALSVEKQQFFKYSHKYSNLILRNSNFSDIPTNVAIWVSKYSNFKDNHRFLAFHNPTKKVSWNEAIYISLSFSHNKLTKFKTNFCLAYKTNMENIQDSFSKYFILGRG